MGNSWYLNPYLGTILPGDSLFRELANKFDPSPGLYFFLLLFSFLRARENCSYPPPPVPPFLHFSGGIWRRGKLYVYTIHQFCQVTPYLGNLLISLTPVPDYISSSSSFLFSGLGKIVRIRPHPFPHFLTSRETFERIPPLLKFSGDWKRHLFRTFSWKSSRGIQSKKKNGNTYAAPFLCRGLSISLCLPRAPPSPQNASTPSITLPTPQSLAPIILGGFHPHHHFPTDPTYHILHAHTI